METDLPFNSRKETSSDVALVENTITGVVDRKVYTSKDEMFSVVRITDSKNRERVLIGPLAGLQDGQDIEAQGYWENHKEYGRRFRVSGYKTVLPSTNAGIERYLASGVVPGIGPKLASRIVKNVRFRSFRTGNPKDTLLTPPLM